MEFFVKTCPVCNLRKVQNVKAPLKPIVTSSFMERCQVSTYAFGSCFVKQANPFHIAWSYGRNINSYLFDSVSNFSNWRSANDTLINTRKIQINSFEIIICLIKFFDFQVFRTFKNGANLPLNRDISTFSYI